MVVGLEAPDIQNLTVGKGVVQFRPEGWDDYYQIGNVPTLTLAFSVTTLDHYSSSADGARVLDLSQTIEKSGQVTMEMEEITAQNLAMLVMGDVTTDGGLTRISIFSRSSLTGELIYYSANSTGPNWQIYLPSVTFKPSGDYSLITDDWVKLPVTGILQAIDGVFGTITLVPAA